MVMIKALGPVHEEYWELEILRYLNTEPLRSHPDNRTVPVEDFLELGQWTFAVMQLWTGCVGDSKIPLNSVTGCLNFMEQILNVRVRQTYVTAAASCFPIGFDIPS